MTEPPEPPPELPTSEQAEPPPPAPPLELELELPPDAAAALWRHPLLGQKRARGVAEDCVWLDTAEQALAARGEALECPRKGPRRHLRVLPRPGVQPPGLAPLPLGEYAPEAVPEAAGEATLLPLAAFTGRRQEASVGPVRLTLRQGNLRCVAAEAPIARLTLSGPAAPLLELAGTLARDLPLLPARASLPEAARALALQQSPRPRRLGPPDLGETEAVTDALALAIGHLTEVLLWHSGRIGPEAGPEGVHQSRVAIRRLRSCLKQFRPVADGRALRELDAMLGELARAMGAARDLDVFLRDLGAALGRAAGEDRRVAALLRVAEARRRAAYDQLAVLLESPGFRALIWSACRLAILPDWDSEPAEAAADGPTAPVARLRPFAAATLARRWRQLKRRGAAIETLDAEALHEMRLAAKRLRYAAELFAPLWPGKPARRFLKRLAVLQEALGLANDTHVARALAAGLGQPAEPAGSGRAGAWAVGLAEGFALARGAGARRDAIRAWGGLRKAEPFWKD